MNRPGARTEPPYLRIVGAIRSRITSGELRAGDRIPSARQITREWGVAIATATKVLAALRQEGLVRAVPGVGTVVRSGSGPTGKASHGADGDSARPGTAPSRPAPPQPAPPHAAPPQPAPSQPVAAPEASDDRDRPDDRGQPADRGLSTERVVRTAIAMADVEGLAGLSMRRVAAQLGVATMSLYRHVHGKDDLLLMMADAALAGVPLPDAAPPGWRAQLELVARLQWAGYRRHPWLAHVISITRPQLLPHGIAHTEWALRALDGLGLDASTMLHATVGLIGYVRGIAMNFEAQAQAEQDTGLTDEEWMEAQDREFAAVLGAGPYPVLAGLAGQPIHLDLDTLFEFGLQRLLDGYAAVIGRAAP